MSWSMKSVHLTQLRGASSFGSLVSNRRPTLFPSPVKLRTRTWADASPRSEHRRYLAFIDGSGSIRDRNLWHSRSPSARRCAADRPTARQQSFAPNQSTRASHRPVDRCFVGPRTSSPLGADLARSPTAHTAWKHCHRADRTSPVRRRRHTPATMRCIAVATGGKGRRRLCHRRTPNFDLRRRVLDARTACNTRVGRVVATGSGGPWSTSATERSRRLRL